MTISPSTVILPEDTIWYGNTGPTIANAPFQGTLLYSDVSNNLIELYNLTNTANIELAISKPDVGENIYFLNSSIVFAYTNFTHLLYLYPPESFYEDDEIPVEANTENSIENYCCINTSTTKDFFGNDVDTTTKPDKRCHGFTENDYVWQQRDDGRRISARVDREDCANGALYVSLATGHFQQNRNIYKDNGSITANIFGAFANLSGKISYSIGVTEEPIAIDRFFTIAPIEEYVIDTNAVSTLITWGNNTDFDGRTV